MTGCYNHCGFGFTTLSRNSLLNKTESSGTKYNGWGEEKEVTCDGLAFNPGRVLVPILLAESYRECQVTLQQLHEYESVLYQDFSYVLSL